MTALIILAFFIGLVAIAVGSFPIQLVGAGIFVTTLIYTITRRPSSRNKP